MIGAASELIAAIRSLLLADATLIAALGGARIHDGAPRDAPLPCVSIDECTSLRRDGVDAVIEEHRLVIRVWSKAGGRRQAIALADRIVALIDDAAPPMASHRVIRLSLEASEARMQSDGIAAEATLRWRALTHPSS